MRASTFVTWLLLLGGVGCGSRQATVGSSLGQEESGAATAAQGSATPLASTAPVAATAPSAGAEEVDAPPELPPPDPQVVKELVAKTGSSPAETDNPLRLRLEVSPRPAGERWLIAVVNRGTEAAQVLFDLRRLTIELEQPEDPSKPRPRWKKKPAPKTCKLPEGFARALTAEEETYSLEPGEGLVQTFDPRLYCIAGNGEAMLATGQVAKVALGFTPKPPRQAWQGGKRVELPSKQSAPFVAEPVTLDPENDRRVKQLVASRFEVTAEMIDGEGEEDTEQPLQLRLLRGSDASTERTATATVEVRARQQKTQLYFRRELVSFTVHGPDGIRGCDPQPDDRAPDRQAYSTLGTVSATSLLAELCPNFTFGRPGLYLVSARLDAVRDGAEFGLRAFTGRLQSRRHALVRITTGDLPPLPPPEPLRVRVGE